MYDLFISFKRNDVDYAKKIRNQLLAIDEDLNIFWSECSLEEIGSSDYTKTIENTIPLCRNMLVVGTSLENITSNWVTYEWSLFKHCQLNDTKGVYNNLFLAIDSSVDIHNLPIALQMSECIPIDNYKKIYSYTKNVEQDVIEKKNREKGFGIISSFLANLGLQNTLFFSPTELSKYESELSEELDSVTIISHTLSQDSPGGALFDTVEENLSKGILYNYIFLNSSQAYGILRKIRNGHTENNREKLILEIAEESFWIFGSFANITIYEFKKGRPSEGYLRCIINSNNNTEFPIFLRVSEAFVDNIWNYVEKFRMENKILRYGDNNESKC